MKCKSNDIIKNINHFAHFFGRKTINQIRTEHGLEKVVGGDIVYIDWVERMAKIPLKPGLKVLQGGLHGRF